MKNIHIYLIPFIFVSTIACKQNVEESFNNTLTNEDLAISIYEVMLEEENHRNKVVLEHYTQIQSGVRAVSMTFEQYSSQLNENYREVILDIQDQLPSMSGENLQTDIASLREKLISESNIPEWYWRMREESRVKIEKVAFSRDSN